MERPTMSSYIKEKELLLNNIKTVYHRYADFGISEIRQKSAFDLVTDIDCNIEQELSQLILSNFPNDHIHGEETTHEQQIVGRTWTIDPIDGTHNMACGIKLYGIQCALFDNGEPVLSVIYLPHFNQLYYAEKGCGCYLNDKPVYVKQNAPLNLAVVSFGDYPHNKSPRIANRQHSAIRHLYTRIAKIRMFGAACIDFASVAGGNSDATVVITRNLWDIAPGILLCKEAGGIIINLEGKPYQFGDVGVIACANNEIAQLLTEAFNGSFSLPIGKQQKEYRACIFDFDGVVVDSEKYHYRAWKKALQLVGFDLTQKQYLPLKSIGRQAVLQFVENQIGRQLSDTERQQVCNEKSRWFEKYAAKLSAKDFIKGVVPFVQYLSAHNIHTAVASSSTLCETMAERPPLNNVFDIVVSGSQPFPKKPAPDIFLAAAQQLEVSPSQCLVFEDSQAGIDAAVAAGMDVIAVGGIKSDKALLAIDNFDKLIELPNK